MSEANQDDDLPPDFFLWLDDPPSEAARLASLERARQAAQATHRHLLGYRRAAELLLPGLADRSGEQLVFPFLSLWRQHLELYLKFLLEIAWEVKGHAGRPPLGHGLLQLWNMLRPFLDADVFDAELDEAARVVTELHDLDPRASEARYADGEAAAGLIESLPKVPDDFKPEHFARALIQVSDLFDGILRKYSR